MEEYIKKIINEYLRKGSFNKKFIPGASYIPVSGKVFDKEELSLGIEAVLDGCWTEGRFAQKFEKEFSKLLGVKYVSLVNSGSSANLIAFSALTSKNLGDKRLKPGDEIITIAAAFPTTVNPIIIHGCIPVFVDVDLRTRNIEMKGLKKALTKKTRAVILAHTLGNPFSLKEVVSFCRKHNLWLIEDCCDALGSKYNNKMVGGFGDVATFSFYPAHQITMGEGGAVVTNNPLLYKSIRQFRDWGRDCWCRTGEDNTCKKRFKWKLGNLPYGYDHKYIYSQIGYNLKLTDLQAAIGVAQLKKLQKFIKIRKINFNILYNFFKKYKRFFILPKWEKDADPCWFGFLIVIKDKSPFTRLELVNFLESKKIATRSLFGGNLLHHPAYKEIKYKKIGNLENSDKITNNGFWIGIYPGIDDQRLKYMINTFSSFMMKYL